MRCALTLIPLLVACGDKDTDSGTTSANTPTYWEHIAPLYRDSCTSCHQDGSLAPFALDSYALAVEWAAASSGAVQARTMPPWGAEGPSESGGEAHAAGTTDPGSCDNDYIDALWLSDEDVAMVADWVAAGMPEGTIQDISVPPAPGLSEGLDLTTPTFTPEPAGGEYGDKDEYRCFLVDPELEDDQWLTAYEVYPGNDAIVHHVIAMPIDLERQSSGDITNGQLIETYNGADGRDGWPCYSQAGDGIVVEGEPVSWAPGQGVVNYPEGSGLEINAGEVFAVQIHYNILSDAPESDATTIRLQLADSVERPGQILLLDRWDVSAISAGDPAAVIDWQLSRNNIASLAGMENVVIEGALPHMHEYGTQMTMSIGTSTEDNTCVTGVRSWNFEWQRLYFYEEPITLESGEAIFVNCTYDLTDAESNVSWGWGTQEEMCLFGLFVTEG